MRIRAIIKNNSFDAPSDSQVGLHLFRNAKGIVSFFAKKSFIRLSYFEE